VSLEQIDAMSSIRIYLPKDLQPIEARIRCGASIREVLKRFAERKNNEKEGGNETSSSFSSSSSGVPMLDAVKDMKVTDVNYG
ncbi:hypothetical protein, partial [Pseudomonas aeruginosa]|uniref:hypothetical protein n=1 Tax=Pseudomonas aeruginosa TaxID=287 RepID=UPI0013CE1DDC